MAFDDPFFEEHNKRARMMFGIFFGFVALIIGLFIFLSCVYRDRSTTVVYKQSQPSPPVVITQQPIISTGFGPTYGVMPSSVGNCIHCSTWGVNQNNHICPMCRKKKCTFCEAWGPLQNGMVCMHCNTQHMIQSNQQVFLQAQQF
jgi:hypothetical protein